MGLIARVLERSGLPTVSMSSGRDITERVRPPRAAFLDYPMGNQVGRPGHPDEQREILRQALALVETVREPGTIVDLPFTWPEPGWEETVVQAYRREAAVVLDQRLRSEYEAGRNFAFDEIEAVRCDC